MTESLQNALNALYLEAPESVVNDIKARVQVALERAGAEKPDPLAAFKHAIKVLDHGFVRLVDVYGGEARILQAARVTTGSGSKGPAEDRGLLRYLMRHRHTSPLEFAEITLHMKLPIYVARQMIRHRTANVNEASARYSEMIDEMHEVAPTEWRAQAESNRQGSSGRVETWPENVELRTAPDGSGYEMHRATGGLDSGGMMWAPEGLKPEQMTPGAYLSAREQDVQELAREVYEERLAFGVAREIARNDMPLSNFTEWYWKIDLNNLLHFLGLRLDEHAQLEIRLYAQAIANIVAQWVPNIWEAFVDYRLDAHTFSRQEMTGVRVLVQKALEDEELLAESDNAPFDRLGYVTTLLPGLPKRELDAFMKAVEIK